MAVATTKKRNPNDTTFRNINALKARVRVGQQRHPHLAAVLLIGVVDNQAAVQQRVRPEASRISESHSVTTGPYPVVSTIHRCPPSTETRTPRSLPRYSRLLSSGSIAIL